MRTYVIPIHRRSPLGWLASSLLCLGACTNPTKEDDLTTTGDQTHSSLDPSASDPSAETTTTPATTDTLPPEQEFVGLVPFSACDDLKAYVVAHASDLINLETGDWRSSNPPGGDDSEDSGDDDDDDDDDEGDVEDGDSEGGNDHSDTNNQEFGVGEPDVIKQNGALLLAAYNGRLQVVDISTGVPIRRSQIDIGASDHPNRVLALIGNNAWITSTRWEETKNQPITVIEKFDLSDPAAPKRVETLTLNGRSVGARTIDGVLRVAVQSGPPVLAFQPWWTFIQDEITPDLPPEVFEHLMAVGKKKAREHNLGVLKAAHAEDWLASYAVQDAAGTVTQQGPLVDCEHAMKPGIRAGLDFLALVSVDLKQNDVAPDSSVGLFATGSVTYASSDRFVVSTQAWDQWVDSEVEDVEGSNGSSRIGAQVHLFDTSALQATYVASGQLKGWVNSQWNFSYFNDHLRVVSTEFDKGWMASRLAVFAVNGQKLDEVGAVEGLGQDESVYAVRMIGDQAFVVTFRQVDPLYAIDLRDPTKPTLRGELKIAGYSAYLHPLAPGYLLGVGRDADLNGWDLGQQVQSFDVSDLDSPTVVSKLALGGSATWSDANVDPHAFLYWEKSRLAFVPLSGWSNGGSDSSGDDDDDDDDDDVILDGSSAWPATDTTDVPPTDTSATDTAHESDSNVTDWQTDSGDDGSYGYHLDFHAIAVGDDHALTSHAQLDVAVALDIDRTEFWAQSPRSAISGNFFFAVCDRGIVGAQLDAGLKVLGIQRFDP